MKKENDSLGIYFLKETFHFLASIAAPIIVCKIINIIRNGEKNKTQNEDILDEINNNFTTGHDWNFKDSFSKRN